MFSETSYRRVSRLLWNNLIYSIIMVGNAGRTGELGPMETNRHLDTTSYLNACGKTDDTWLELSLHCKEKISWIQDEPAMLVMWMSKMCAQSGWKFISNLL